MIGLETKQRKTFDGCRTWLLCHRVLRVVGAAKLVKNQVRDLAMGQKKSSPKAETHKVTVLPGANNIRQQSRVT